MKKISNWFWLGLLAGVVVLCLILIQARRSNPGISLETLPPSPTGTVPGTPQVTAPAADVTVSPTAVPTAEPTDTPTAEPTAEPTGTPTAEPTVPPTASPEATPEPTESGETFEVVGPVAFVVMGDYVVDAVDLGTVTENFTRTYPGLDGAENVVEFAPGQARMLSSTCPDQVCVGMDWQDGSFPLPIACLPNSVMVIIQTVEAPEESPSATAGLDGVTG